MVVIRNYEDFAALTKEQKRQCVKNAARAMDAIPGEKFWIDADQLRCDYMFGKITFPEYERKLFQYGVACRQFRTLYDY